MSKKEIDALVQQCQELGWQVEPTSKGFYRVLPPEGDAIITPSTANGRALGNFKAELRRAGFNPEAVQAAKAEKAEAAIAEDRRKNDAALARAAARAKEAATTPAPITPQKAPTLTNPFAAPTKETPAAENISTFSLLSGYPREAVLITQKQSGQFLTEAKERQENGGCRQRSLYATNAAKLQQAMELGEWELNPADSLVFCQEHHSLVNGQHRMKALESADSEFIDEFYPNGVPFYITNGFPCAMSHIFDTGKARSASDALAVEGLLGWGPLAAAALRLALHYDRSFEGGNKNWGQWSAAQFTNTELVAAASGDYSGLQGNSKIVSRAYTQSKMTRSATMVAAFLMSRDNPGGNPENGRTNELFWKGVSGDDGMLPGDPRMAIIRVAMRTGSKYRSDNGPTMLAHLLKGYANYMIGSKKVDISTVSKDIPMVPVWKPGMRWFSQELRYPKN